MLIEAMRGNNYLNILGIIDDTMEIGESVFDVKVIGGEDVLPSLKSSGLMNIVLSFTSLKNLKLRESKYIEYKKMGFSFPNIIHSKATVEPSVKMGEGNIVVANSMLGSDLKIGNVNFINTGSILSHDTVVNDNNHFAPNAVLAGRINVGSNNLFGMCSTVYFDVAIGDNNIINNGVNVFKNVSNNNHIK